jgi:hypothetical protein
MAENESFIDLNKVDDSLPVATKKSSWHILPIVIAAGILFIAVGLVIGLTVRASLPQSGRSSGKNIYYDVR